MLGCKVWLFYGSCGFVSGLSYLPTVLESLVEAGYSLPWQALVEEAQAGGK